MGAHLQIVAFVVTIGVFGLVVDLVRRRRLQERYALLWLVAGLVLLVLELWGDLLDAVGRLTGIAYPPTTLFLIAFGFVLLMLVHFSVVISSLSNQNKLLAQRLALLQQQLDEQSLGEVTVLPLAGGRRAGRRRSRFAATAIGDPADPASAPPVAGAR